MKKKVFISTAIPYVNALPHVGHSLEFVQTDALARYFRLVGNDVFFLSGTDENAQKNVQAAEKENTTPQKLVDKYSRKFYQFKSALNISFDDFIRTTENRHYKGSQKLWKLCSKDIYKKKYKGLYCGGCEAFVTQKELVDGKCPEHINKKPEIIEEENYFFHLKKYEKQLFAFIKNDRIKITPNERKNEVLSFIEQGLEDFSVSRDAKRMKGWGIPVPGDISQIIYVWFDALINYITGLDFAGDQKLYKKFWENAQNRIHVIGKGIIRFHAVYWPAMLLSAGLPLPTQEFVHGYVTVNSQKISKSLGNVINPFDLIKKYGADAVRYYLLKEIHPFKDGDFSYQRFEEIYNADLANGLGNLVQRTAKLAENAKFKMQNLKLQFKIQNYKIYNDLIKKYKYNECLIWIWRKIRKLDKYIDKTKPWEKSGKRLTRTLQTPVIKILEIAVFLKPFLPETAEKIEKIFTAEKIKAPKTPLFPRI